MPDRDVPPDRAPLVRFEGVSKSFGAASALDDVSLDIKDREFFALLGPSGCGKTTLLRLLAGFEIPDRGRVLLEDADIGAQPPHRRPVNMMFQSYALFPHLTVAGNVAFGLRQDGLPRSEIDARVEEMLALVRLEGLAGRKPHQLSGGQRQRVALARALVKRPKIFLLDEPLAALDKKLRMQTQLELRALQRRLGVTFLIVTHDQEEAMAMADRIAVMDHGRLIQVASPREIYERPNSRWVAEFIGEINLLEGVVARAGANGIEVDTPAGMIAASSGSAQPDARVFVAIRPEKIALRKASGTETQGGLAGTVSEAGYLGDFTRYAVTLGCGLTLKVSAANAGHDAAQTFAIGERVLLSWPVEPALVLTQ